MEVLLQQVDVDVGGDVDQMERWDPNQTGHDHLLNKLGGRVTDAAPLRLLWQKELKGSDVNSQQNSFLLHKNAVENSIVRCLTIQQRDDLCNNRVRIQIAAFDEQGTEWELTLLKRTQKGNANGTYVAIKDWMKMVNANRWRAGNVIKIWGQPYAGVGDQWRFGRDHGYSDITFVFTTTV